MPISFEGASKQATWGDLITLVAEVILHRDEYEGDDEGAIVHKLSAILHSRERGGS